MELEGPLRLFQAVVHHHREVVERTRARAAIELRRLEDPFVQRRQVGPPSPLGVEASESVDRVGVQLDIEDLFVHGGRERDVARTLVGDARPSEETREPLVAPLRRRGALLEHCQEFRHLVGRVVQALERLERALFAGRGLQHAAVGRDGARVIVELRRRELSHAQSEFEAERRVEHLREDGLVRVREPAEGPRAAREPLRALRPRAGGSLLRRQRSARAWPRGARRVVEANL